MELNGSTRKDYVGKPPIFLEIFLLDSALLHLLHDSTNPSNLGVDPLDHQPHCLYHPSHSPPHAIHPVEENLL